MKIGRFDRRAGAIVSAFTLQGFFFAPLRVFLNNTNDFTVGLSHVLVALLLASATLLAVLYLAATVWPRVLLPAVTFLSLVSFLELTIFLGLAQHRPFDGQPIDWAPLGTLAAVELTVMTVVGLLVVVFRRHSEVWYSVSLSILLFHFLGLGHTVVSRPTALRQLLSNFQDQSYFADFYRLSRKRNVIHIVPDAAQGAMVYDIFQSDLKRYSEAFDGFTFFTQAMGRYPSTYPSVPFLMTGLSPDPEHDFSPSQAFTWEYVRRTLTDRSIVTTLATNGFKTFGFQFFRLFCVAPYSACAAGDVFAGLPISAGGTGADVLKLQDVALFQATPIVIRQHIYDGGDWFLTGRSARKAQRTYSGVMDTFLAQMTTDSRAGSYNYFHVAGGHPPLQFDEHCNYTGAQEFSYANQRRQVACTLVQIERLIGTLKRLGIYDQTMIVVNGDHGTPGLPPSMASEMGRTISMDLVGTASALLLIKPMGARGPLKFSGAPAVTGDIPATINSALALNGRFPGKSLLEVDGLDRERQYFWYDESDRVSQLQALPNLRRYRVRGNLFDEKSWIRPVLSDVGKLPGVLWVDHENFYDYAVGFGELELQSGPARWITGTHARVFLSFPTSRRARFVLESYVPSDISGQSAEISVNDRVIALLDERTLAATTRHVVLVPENVPRRAVNTIDVKMAKAVRLKTDARELSMVVAYIGLEPAE